MLVPNLVSIGTCPEEPLQLMAYELYSSYGPESFIGLRGLGLPHFGLDGFCAVDLSICPFVPKYVVHCPLNCTLLSNASATIHSPQPTLLVKLLERRLFSSTI